MKLVYVANARIPTEKAHGIQIMKMCEALSVSADLELILPRRFNSIKEDPFLYYGVKRNFKIKKLLCLDLIFWGGLWGKFAFWLQSCAFLISLAPHILFKKSDILYTRDKFFLVFAFFKKNIVFEAHAFPQNYFLYALFFKKTKKIITITQKLKELFLEKGLPEGKILVAPDGVDLREFDIKDDKDVCRKDLGLPPNKRIIGYAGRLDTMGEEKGIDILITALKILKGEFSDLILCCVGGPKKKIDDYSDFASKIGLAKDDLIFRDQVKRILVPKYLKSFDILILPFPYTRHYAFYASPLKLFEYMASKRPIVASNLPSIREVLNEENAILVEPGDPENLAKGIKKLLQDPILSDRIGGQAFERVRQYTWERRAQNIYGAIK